MEPEEKGENAFQPQLQMRIHMVPGAFKDMNNVIFIGFGI